MMNFSTFLGKEKETFESRKKQNFKINRECKLNCVKLQ